MAATPAPAESVRSDTGHESDDPRAHAPRAPPTPEDKSIAQHLAYEAVIRLVRRPEDAVGCMLAYREPGAIDAIPLHAVAPKQFDWEVFARMHGTEL